MRVFLNCFEFPLLSHKHPKSYTHKERIQRTKTQQQATNKLLHVHKRANTCMYWPILLHPRMCFVCSRVAGGSRGPARTRRPLPPPAPETAEARLKGTKDWALPLIMPRPAVGCFLLICYILLEGFSGVRFK